MHGRKTWCTNIFTLFRTLPISHCVTSRLLFAFCMRRFKYNSNVISDVLGGLTMFFCVLFWLGACTPPVFSQMLNVSQAADSPAVSLVYTVKNGTVYLNGTAASNLLGQLSAELVGYFLFYPPLAIAERKLQCTFQNTSVRQEWFSSLTRGDTIHCSCCLLERFVLQTQSRFNNNIQKKFQDPKDFLSYSMVQHSFNKWSPRLLLQCNMLQYTKYK